MSVDNVVNMATMVRPRTFSEMVGQPYATGVGKQIGKGKISGQGYILVGPKGCGKTSLARIIAKSLNCENRNPDTGDPCLQCGTCQSIDNDSYRYVEEINSASYRGINDIKAKIADRNLTPPRGYRVYILDEAHMLTKDAFSALLKPIEEPGKDTIFIMTTTNPEVIPETILSRSPIITIRSLSNEDLKTILSSLIEKGKEIDPEWESVTEADIQHAILSSSGSARQAITTLSGIIYHGISHSDDVMDTTKIIEGFLQQSTEKVLIEASTILSDKTADPVTIITSIIYGLFDAMKSSPESAATLSRQVAHLSSLIGEVASATPSLIASAKIAACVNPGIEHVVEEKKEKPARKKDSVSSPTKSKKNTKGNKKKDEEVKKMSLTPDTTLDDVYNHLFSTQSEKVLDEQWLDILDDEEESDLYVDSSGKLIVTVKQPDAMLTYGLHKLFDNVKVGSFGGSKKESFEPPF